MTLHGQQVHPPPSMPPPTVHTERSGASSPSVFRSFVKMTDVWKSNLMRKELHNFPCLTSLPNISVTNLNKYTGLLEKLKNEFEVKRFSDLKFMDNYFALFTKSIAIDLDKVKPEMQQEVADLQCDTYSYIQMHCKELTDFHIYLSS